jgi:kinetochore protein SLK19
MGPDQIDKQISWLDEQRRKDAEQIKHLERKLESALEVVNSQENQIKQLTSEVTRLAALTTQIRQFDDALGKQRDSFSQKISDSEGLFLERQKHHEDIRKHDYEELSKSLSELQLELRDIGQIKDALEARKQEEIRIQREIDTFNELQDRFEINLDEQIRNVNSVEESRRLDVKRIADLQSESTELRVKLDSLRGAQDTVEDRLRRMEAEIDKTTKNVEGRNEIYTLWEEKQELRIVEFEKKWKEWQSVFDAIQQKAMEVDERIIKYDENYRALSQTRLDLDKVIEKLERRISEISEMQRFNDERIKQEWTSYQSDEQKRWNTHKLTNDELWRDHGRIHEKMANELTNLDEKLSDSISVIEEIADNSYQRIMDLFATVSDWAEAIDKKSNEIK